MSQRAHFYHGKRNCPDGDILRINKHPLIQIKSYRRCILRTSSIKMMENVIYGFDTSDLIYEGFYVLRNKRKPSL